MNLKKILQHQAGFSLLQVLISISLLSVVSLGMMEIMKTTSKSAASNQLSYDVSKIEQEVAKVMGNLVFCTETLKGMNLGSPIPAIKILKDDGTTTDRYTIGQVIDQIKIANIELSDLASFESTYNGGFAKVIITFDKNGSSASPKDIFGGKTIRKEIPVFVDNCAFEAIGGGPTASHLIAYCEGTLEGKIRGEVEATDTPDYFTAICSQCTKPRTAINECIK